MRAASRQRLNTDLRFINTHGGIKQCNHVKIDTKMPRNLLEDMTNKKERCDQYSYNESGTSAP